MKSKLWIIPALVLCIVSCLAFTACGDNGPTVQLEKAELDLKYVAATEGVAEHFDVPEEFLLEAVSSYRARFGIMTTLTINEGEFAIFFEPTLRVRRLYRTRTKKRAIKRGDGTDSL